MIIRATAGVETGFSPAEITNTGEMYNNYQNHLFLTEPYYDVKY